MTPPRKAPAKAADAVPGPLDDGERTRLTRAAVTERALALADASGLDGLTIRKLAADLGVTPMALYWHFRSKEELLDGLVERVWGEIDISVDRTAPWPDQLRKLFNSLLAVLRAHPAATQLLAQKEKMNNEAALAATEVTLDVLRRAGFGPEEASAIARSALWTALQLVMSDPALEGADETERAEIQRQHQVKLATLPLGKYPRLVECAVPMTACDDPAEHYRFGLGMFMAGVTALAGHAQTPAARSAAVS